MNNLWKEIKDLILEGWEQIGFTGTLFFIFFWVAHYYYFRSHSRVIKKMQDEINRLAAENREYRNKFMELVKDTIKKIKTNNPTKE